ncbi:Transposase [Clostridiales bacterium CHKCI001]|nr:Transposase [Clostridiales bacterium CHKCI001]
MTHRNRKRYPEEFKKQIVNFYNVGTPVAKLASEYGSMA